MTGLVLIDPTRLYNLLNQGERYPKLSDPNYMLLLDAREKADYDESHIITAKKAPKKNPNDFEVPYGAELECKQFVIVYDGRTRSLKEEGPAYHCARIMWDMGSRNPVHILTGGYEDFSALYPFLRTQKIIYMPRELDEIKTYPLEVIPGFLYLGNWQHGNTPYIQKDLKIKAHVNCAMEEETFFQNINDMIVHEANDDKLHIKKTLKNGEDASVTSYSEPNNYLIHIKVEDSPDSNIYSKFEAACDFIDDHKERKFVVLVFSKLGISRSVSVVLAYLMYTYKWTLEEAYENLKQVCDYIRPNRGFIEQLSRWEKEVLDPEPLTDISDPYY